MDAELQRQNLENAWNKLISKFMRECDDAEATLEELKKAKLEASGKEYIVLTLIIEKQNENVTRWRQMKMSILDMDNSVGDFLDMVAALLASRERNL